MRPPPLARQASHPSAGDTGAPPAGGNLAVAVPHEGAVGLFIVPEETGLGGHLRWVADRLGSARGRGQVGDALLL